MRIVTLRPPDLAQRRPDPMGLIGQTLDGQFRVDEVIGEGGFSVVYKGHHLGLGEAIAIKCLRLEASLGSAMVESFVRRFRDEGRILYRLSQGNLHIVRSVASGTTIAPATSSLIPYIVLEWLEGCSLGQDLDRRRAAGMRGRTLDEVMLLLDSAAMAVAYAHEAGVVHRDLNPGNIFLTQTREGVKAKVLDFGLAKVVSDHHLELGPRAATYGKIRIFSPAYAAPEQLDDRVGKIAPWTDVYTFAIVMLEALCDDPPISGDDLGVIVGKTLDPAHRPTPRALGLGPDRVPDAVEAAFARALALDPRERFRDLGEMWGTLKAALRRPDPPPAMTPPQKKRRDITPTELLFRPEDVIAGGPQTQRMVDDAGGGPSKPPAGSSSSDASSSDVSSSDASSSDASSSDVSSSSASSSGASSPSASSSSTSSSDVSRSSAASFPRFDQTLRMDDPSLQSMARSFDRARANFPMQVPVPMQMQMRPPMQMQMWPREHDGSSVAGTGSTGLVRSRSGIWLVVLAILVGATLALFGLLLVASVLHVRSR
jgi:eukaryotic-like serine/threonine-protein kinase